MGQADLTLAAALAAGRLEEFIEQEEARGIPAIAEAEFDAALAAAIRQPPAEDRTPPSSSGRG